MTVINLDAARTARERPDPKLIGYVREDEEYRSFLIEYTHDGLVYGSHIFARDWKDAGDRVRSISATGGVLGEIHIVEE